MQYVKTIIIKFSNTLMQNEISAFRGAVIASLEKDNILFHNHREDKFRYAYPLIQYKRIDGKAAIVCIGEGTEAIGEFFASGNFWLDINGREMVFRIADIDVQRTVVECQQMMSSYQLHDWLPLNESNYTSYLQKESLMERICLLEKILTGNILSALKGMGIRAEDRVACTIKACSESRLVQFKRVKLMSMNATFSCNLTFPDFIGLGRHTSVGFGTIKKN